MCRRKFYYGHNILLSEGMKISFGSIRIQIVTIFDSVKILKDIDFERQIFECKLAALIS